MIEDTEDGYDEMTEAEAAAFNAEMEATAKKCEAGTGEKTPPAEVELTPGQILFNSLKNNPSTESVDEAFKNRGSFLKYASEAVESLKKQAIDRHNAGYNDEWNILVMALMTQSHSKVILPSEYDRLDGLIRACGNRIKTMLTTPKSETQNKVARAYGRAEIVEF